MVMVTTHLYNCPLLHIYLYFLLSPEMNLSRSFIVCSTLVSLFTTLTSNAYMLCSPSTYCLPVMECVYEGGSDVKTMVTHWIPRKKEHIF